MKEKPKIRHINVRMERVHELPPSSQSLPSPPSRPSFAGSAYENVDPIVTRKPIFPLAAFEPVVAVAGGQGNDSLFGMVGNDILHGGTGDDLVAGMEGDDWVNGDSGDDWVTGAEGDDTLYGGGGLDILNGASGNDVLSGGIVGDGFDQFIFDSAPGGTNVDTILGFERNIDVIALSQAIFTDSRPTLEKKEFYAGKKAHDGNDRIIIKAKKGELYFDHDGKGGDAQMLFAVVDKKLDLSHTDFEMAL